MSYSAKKPFMANQEHVIGTVTFMNAKYRNKPIEGQYDVIKGFQEGGNGEGFITVREPTGKRSRITVFKESGYKLQLNDNAVKPVRPRGRPRKVAPKSQPSANSEMVA